MVDGVNTSNCVEAGVREGQLRGRVHNAKFSTLRQSTLSGERISRRNCVFMNVNPHHRAAGEGGSPQHWATRATGDIQQRLARGKIKPTQKPVVLGCCGPTALSDVLA